MRHFLLDLIYPRYPRCFGCGDPRRTLPDMPLCLDCFKKLNSVRVPAEACPVCLCYKKKNKPCSFCQNNSMKNIRQSYAPFLYLSPAIELVRSLKFEGTDDALPLLCENMFQSLNGNTFDALVPVPLHPVRKRERGYNQAMLLAEGLSQMSGIPVTDALKRVKATKPQTTLDAEKKRRSNVENAFAPNGAIDIKNMNILLIDDVRTTGSTADNCADILLKSGAGSVSLCTVCVTFMHEG